ncbi:putative quinol monooxygenase [Vibrio sp. nBUS_14]|jgi:quinol monooxygenase YgiN|uniref:putative quinol monooxygenase n=2 Tax=unclassified Vibrio TaxID=2614977 RepID=UPI003EB6F85C
MLSVVAFITPKSEFYAECKQKAEGILTATREEAGCLRFELHENQAKDQLILVENWADQAALEEHYAQPYITPIFEFYKTALAQEPEIHKMTNVEG